MRLMARGWLFFAVSFLLLAAIPASSLAAEARPFGQGLLFRVERPGHALSHVFGTMHTTDERVLDWPEQVTAAIDASKRLVLELAEPDPKVHAQEMADHLVLRDGRTLLTIVGEKTFAQTSEIASRYGMRRLQFGLLKPIGVFMVFMYPPRDTKRVAEGWAFLDHALQIEAKGLGVPVFGLEEFNEQLRYFTEVSEPDQVLLLRYAIDHHDTWMENFDALLERYLAGDLDA